MKSFKNKSFRALSLVLAISLFTYGFTLALNFPVKAAPLITVAASASPITASTLSVVTLTFTPVTAITTGSIVEVTYDTGFTGGAALVDPDIAVAATNYTSSVESAFAAGYFKSTITASAPITTVVTITIGSTNKLTNPAFGNYGWGVTVDVGGAGTTYDYGAGLSYIASENIINVTAQVPPVIDMELYTTTTDTLMPNTAPQNLCNLGVLSINAVKTCVYDIGYATNNITGLTVKAIRNGALTDGSAHNITDVADGTVTAGSSEYGFRVTTIGTGCGATAASTYGSSDMAVPAAATTIFSSNTICNGTTAGQASKRTIITHKASMDAATYVGAYTQTVTWTAFTN
ncbi:MAG: hypothetical protein WCJ58_04445 [bacterium]